MDTSPDSQIQHNYNAIMALRLAIVFCGTKTPPNVGHMMLLSSDDEFTDLNSDEELENPRKAEWELYEYKPECECPVHAIGCPSWLVRGALLIKGPDVKFGEIDPADWTTGLREVHAQIPSSAIDQPTTQELLEWFASAADNTPAERLTIMREAIARKVAELSNPNRCRDRDAHGESSVKVVVIGL